MGIITNPQLRSRATQDDILLAFADRLREHELLNEQNVVVTDQQPPEDMPGGGFCIAVSPGDGAFPHELWDAGHHAQACEDGSVVIGIYTHIRRDRRGRAEFLMFGRRFQARADTGDNRRPSLMQWKLEILRLLVLGDPTLQDVNGQIIDSARQAWEPSKDGIPLCREIPKPVRVTGILDLPDHPGWRGFQLTVSIAWDWNLYV